LSVCKYIDQRSGSLLSANVAVDLQLERLKFVLNFMTKFRRQEMQESGQCIGHCASLSVFINSKSATSPWNFTASSSRPEIASPSVIRCTSCRHSAECIALFVFRSVFTSVCLSVYPVPAIGLETKAWF